MTKVDPTSAKLVKLGELGLKAMDEGRFEEAVARYKEILAIRPDWEEGQIFYDLACALEESGNLHEAREAYQKALSYRPNETIFWGGFASFLYLYGDPQEAFDAYLTTYKIEKQQGQTELMERTLIGIMALGKKLELSEEEIKQRLESESGESGDMA